MGRAMTEGGERSIWVVAIEESNALRDPLGSKFRHKVADTETSFWNSLRDNPPIKRRIPISALQASTASF